MFTLRRLWTMRSIRLGRSDRPDTTPAGGRPTRTVGSQGHRRWLRMTSSTLGPKKTASAARVAATKVTVHPSAESHARRVLPTNRREVASDVGVDDLRGALECLLHKFVKRHPRSPPPRALPQGASSLGADEPAPSVPRSQGCARSSATGRSSREEHDRRRCIAGSSLIARITSTLAGRGSGGRSTLFSSTDRRRSRRSASTASRIATRNAPTTPCRSNSVTRPPSSNA